MSNLRFRLSDNFINFVLNTEFSEALNNYQSLDIYVGLGIEFDENTFSFTKEPVAPNFTILDNPCEFSHAEYGIIRNLLPISWPKAEEDWTVGDETIKYVGLYYELKQFDPSAESGSLAQESDSVESLIETSGSDIESNYTPKYELIGVLPLAPAETVLEGEMMVLNPGSIQIKLTNR